MSKAFAESDLVPEHFRGNIANCFIGLQFAQRANLDPFGVLQKLYVVRGKPGIEATLAIALLQQSGLIEGPIRYEFSGEGDEYGCEAIVTDARTGNLIVGPKIDWAIVKAEGWHTKSGSKWPTMSQQMFRYRSASWLIKSHYPGVTLGCQTVDELEDSMTVDAPKYQAVDDIAPKTLDDLRRDNPQRERIPVDISADTVDGGQSNVVPGVYDDTRKQREEGFQKAAKETNELFEKGGPDASAS